MLADGRAAVHTFLCLFVFLFAQFAAPAMAQQSLPDLERRAKALYDDGRYANAIPIGRQAVALAASEAGADDPRTAASLDQLGRALSANGRYDEALKHHKQALAIRQRRLGAKHPDTGMSLLRIGKLYLNKGRVTDGTAALERARGIMETARAVSPANLAELYGSLAWLTQLKGRYGEALELAEKAYALSAKARGPEHPETASYIDALGSVKRDLGQPAGALEDFRRAQAIREKKLRKGHPDQAHSLHNVALGEEGKGRYAEAEALYQRAVQAFTGAFGAKHVQTAVALNSLGMLYWTLGNFTSADEMLERVRAIREAELGASHNDTGEAIANLGLSKKDQGKFTEAEPLLKRGLAISEAASGPDDPRLAIPVNNLGGLYETLGRYDEALSLFERARRLREKSLGAEDLGVTSSLINIAIVHQRRGNAGPAEEVYRRALAIHENATGPDHPGVATILQNLGTLFEEQGRYAEAEAAQKRALGIREKSLGLEHPDVALNLHNLAKLYSSLGRPDDAIALMRRAMAIEEKAFGPGHPRTAANMHNMAGVLLMRKNHAEAEALLKRALDTREKIFGPDHPDVAHTSLSLGLLYNTQMRPAEAEPMLRRALAIREKLFGAEHPMTAECLAGLADMYGNAQQLAPAIEYSKRVMELRSALLGQHHPMLAFSKNTLALYYARNGQMKEALEQTRQVTDLIAGYSRIERERLKGWKATSAGVFAGRELMFSVNLLLSRIAGDMKAEPQESIAADTFVTAQWAKQTSAASALTQMALRASTQSPELARQARRRQDLAEEWTRLDSQLTAAATSAPASRNLNEEKQWRQRLESINGEIADIDRQLETGFPEFAALSNPVPLTPEEVRALLRPDEVLVQFHFSAQSYVWVIGRDTLVFKALTEDPPKIAQRVQALRCGLDAAAWLADEGKACRELLDTQYSARDAQMGKPLPFDVRKAHELYNVLLGPVAGEIAGKHLLIVPAGPLTSLPLQTLVAADPGQETVPPAKFAEVQWLGAQQAVTVLPSVPSLKALRKLVKEGRAGKPFIGFGNPLLTGSWGSDRRAWEYQQCAKAMPPVEEGSRAVPPVPRSLGQSAVANPDMLRKAAPLPETALELCMVAQSLGAPEEDVLLGAKATVSTVKSLNKSASLAKYRTVHFATHGLVAGDLLTLKEPALLMTPPERADENDDGLLKASDVAQLSLNAEWVVMSACNTAAGGENGAEALSGLARAFFYAGAKSLLVSHWAVDTNAAIELTTGTFSELSQSPDIGRSEAMRRTVAAIIHSGEARRSHPSYWAPFIVVGEGAR